MKNKNAIGEIYTHVIMGALIFCVVSFPVGAVIRWFWIGWVFAPLLQR